MCVCVCMCVCTIYIALPLCFQQFIFQLLIDNENITNSISNIPRKNENFSFTFAHFDILRPIIVQLKLEYFQW